MELDTSLFPLELKPPFRHVRGYGYEYVLPKCTEDYGNIPGQSMRSPFILHEDGKPLLLRHATNVDIWYCGGGRYSQWGAGLYFAPSDNSDPNTNGKRYTVHMAQPSPDTHPLPQRVHVTLSHSCNLCCRICRDKAKFCRTEIFFLYAIHFLKELQHFIFYGKLSCFVYFGQTSCQNIHVLPGNHCVDRFIRQSSR